MGDMLQELLALSRLETGEKALEIVAIDVAYVLQEVVDDAKKLARYDHHDLQLVLNSDDCLLADLGELRSAISNLVFNAVNYTPAACKIIVSWTVDEQQAVISVSDEGGGIAEHHLDRLTERFYRVDSGRSQSDGGTGLGLAIVKHVLQRHEGQLKVTSELGQGSVFSCCFLSSSIVGKSRAVDPALS
jgi:two-component system phosphate regulon sensor histidine kinase PhoR